MGFDPITLAAVSLALTAGATGFAAVEQRKTRKSTESQFDKQEQQTASELEKARTAEADAIAAAEKKTTQRQQAIQAGGRPSTFAADAFGLRTPADIRKKTLG